MAAPTSFLLEYGLGWAATPQAQLSAYQAFQEAGADLMSVESGMTSALQPHQVALPPAQLAELQGQGRQVVAYVNAAVTDHTRAYWQADGADWVQQINPAQGDVGPVTAQAPDWLVANRGVISWGDGGAASTGYIADLTSAAWRQIVVDQAVAQVVAGYDGVFLDDVGAYLPAGHAGGPYDPAYAIAMMQTVVAVADAIHAVNAQAIVVVNSGVNILFDSLLPADDPRLVAYRAALDAMLLESQYATEIDADATPQTTTQDALSDAVARFGDLPILSVEYAPGFDIGRYLAFCGTRGILPNLPGNLALTGPVSPPVMGTMQADWIVLNPLQHTAAGLAGNDRITGTGGADQIFGHAGRDGLAGGGGADLLRGDVGDDRLSGGRGADTLTGGTGSDRFIFADHGGRDVITEFQPKDRILITSGATTSTEVTLTDRAHGLSMSFSGTVIILTGIHLADFSTDSLIFL